MIDSLSIAIHAFFSRVSMSFSVDETLLPRLVNLSTSFRELPSSVEMTPVSVNHRVKWREIEKDKYLDFVRELKKLLNMKLRLYQL